MCPPLSIPSHGDFLCNKWHCALEYNLWLLSSSVLTRSTFPPGSLPQPPAFCFPWTGGISFCLSFLPTSRAAQFQPFTTFSTEAENPTPKAEGLTTRWHSVEDATGHRTECLKTSLKNTTRVLSDQRSWKLLLYLISNNRTFAHIRYIYPLVIIYVLLLIHSKYF